MTSQRAATSSYVATTFSLNESEMKDLLSVLGEVDNDVKEVFSLQLTAAQWAAIPNIASCVAYQGFDPNRVILEFMRRSRAQPSDVIRNVTVGQDTMEVCEGTNAIADLTFLLRLFITRGNNVAKILLKCNAADVDIITRKCSQYGISTTERQRAALLGPSVITLARLSQAFAPATAAIIVRHDISGNLRTKLFPGIVLPTLLTHTIFPALLSEEDTELIEVAKYLNVETSIMLCTPKDKRRMMTMTLSDLLVQSESYVLAAINGSISEPALKKKALVKGNIIDDRGAPTTVTRAMISLCGRLHALGHETYSNAVRRMAEITPN